MVDQWTGGLFLWIKFNGITGVASSPRQQPNLGTMVQVEEQRISLPA